MEKIIINKEKSAILVDLDGTIFNIDARLQRALSEAGVSQEEVNNTATFYRDNRRFAFFEELFNPQAIMQLDVPIEGSVEKLNALAKFFNIFYISSRPIDEHNSDTFDATTKCLEENGFPDGVLVMRPRAQKKATFFLQNISEIIERGFKIEFAIDDGFDGVSQYEAFGINLIRVDGKTFDIPNICVKYGDVEVCI